MFFVIPENPKMWFTLYTTTKNAIIWYEKGKKSNSERIPIFAESPKGDDIEYYVFKTFSGIIGDVYQIMYEMCENIFYLII